MKKLIALAAILAGATVMIGCTSTKTLTDRLANHRFVLVEANGVTLTQQQLPFIKFTPTTQNNVLQVSGKMCNAFNGQAYINKNTLFSNGIVTTRSICADTQLNALDLTLGQILQLGTLVNYRNGTLILTTPDTKLVFKEDFANELVTKSR